MVVTTEEEGHGGPFVCGSQGHYYTYYSAQVSPSTRNDPAQNANSTETENPCSKQIGNFTFICVILFFNIFIYLFIWLHWVFAAVHGLSLVAASRG